MLRWYIDYFGLKLRKKQLVPKKKKKKTNSDHPPPNSVLLESRKQTPVGRCPPYGRRRASLSSERGDSRQESCINAYCWFFINLIKDTPPHLFLKSSQTIDSLPKKIYKQPALVTSLVLYLWGLWRYKVKCIYLSPNYLLLWLLDQPKESERIEEKFLLYIIQYEENLARLVRSSWAKIRGILQLTDTGLLYHPVAQGHWLDQSWGACSKLHYREELR